MGKKLTPQIRIRRMMGEGLTQAEIGGIVGLSKRQVQRIASGKTPGKSIEAPLREYAGLGKRAQAAVKRGGFALPSRREPRPKKVEAPEPEPEPQEIAAPPLPKKVEVTIKGNLGPSNDPDYIRKRTIRTTLRDDVAARFAELYEADQFEALRFATSAYFGGHGEGHLESVIGSPEVYYTYSREVEK